MSAGLISSIEDLLRVISLSNGDFSLDHVGAGHLRAAAADVRRALVQYRTEVVADALPGDAWGAMLNGDEARGFETPDRTASRVVAEGAKMVHRVSIRGTEFTLDGEVKPERALPIEPLRAITDIHARLSALEAAFVASVCEGISVPGAGGNT